MRKLSMGNYLPLFHQNARDFEGGTIMRGIQRVLSAKCQALCVLFIIVILISGGLIPSSAAAATYYVATNGSNSNPGTLARPFRTLNKGVSVLQPGDTLYVRDGIYAEALIDNIPGGTSWTNPVTVAAYPGNCGSQTCETVTLRPISPISRASCLALEQVGCIFRVIHFSLPGQHHIIIDGLTIDARGIVTEGIKITDSSHDIKIQNSVVKNSPSLGVLVTATNNQIVNTDIHDIGVGYPGPEPAPHCIYLAGSNGLIERNTIYNCAGYGIHIYSEGPSANGNIVRYNVVHDVGTFSANSAGILIGSGGGHIAHNNIVYGNPNGIYVGFGPNPTTNNEVYNNTIYKNDKGGNQTGIYVVNGSNVQVKNNIVFANPNSIFDTGIGTVLSNNLTTDPSFVNAAAGDFRLRPGSAAIGAGAAISDPELSHDFAGVVRPPFDIGAYQYRPASPPSPPRDVRVAP